MVVAALPPYLLATVIDYACAPYDVVPKCCRLGELICFGCACKSFLAALKYVEILRLDLIGRSALNFQANAAGNSLLCAEYDGHVRRWCDIASRRLNGVLRFGDGEDVRVYNSSQTRMIVNCAASFPNLEELDICNGEPMALCAEIVENVRAGRLRCLRRLVLEGPLYPPAVEPAQAMFAFRDLVGSIPSDRGMDVLLHGVYPKLLFNAGEYDAWSSQFWALVAQGADMHSRPILCEFFDACVIEGPWPHEDFYRLFEKLLVEHHVNPNARGEYYPGGPRWTVLWMVLNAVQEVIYDLDRGDTDSLPDRHDPYLSFSMRILDLLVAHGAVSSGESVGDSQSEPVNDELSSWILARQDCTSRVQEAVKRGELRW